MSYRKGQKVFVKDYGKARFFSYVEYYAHDGNMKYSKKPTQLADVILHGGVPAICETSDISPR